MDRCRHAYNREEKERERGGGGGGVEIHLYTDGGGVDSHLYTDGRGEAAFTPTALTAATPARANPPARRAGPSISSW